MCLSPWFGRIKVRTRVAFTGPCCQAGKASVSTVIFLLLVFIAAAYIGYRYSPDYLTRPAKDTPPAVSESGGAVGPAGSGQPGMAGGAPAPEAAPSEAPRPVVPMGLEAPVDASSLLKEGRYVEAVEALRAELDVNPGSEELRGVLAHTLNLIALGRYDEKDFAGASDLFKEALTFSDDPAIIKNLAFSQIALEDFSAAAETLTPLISDPEMKKTLRALYLKLGDLHYGSDDTGTAADWFQKAYDLDPSDDRLRQTIDKLRAEDEAESGMERKEGRHFLVKFDGTENAVAGHLIGLLLEEAYYKVGSDLGFYPSERIEAVLYSGVRFHDITRSPSWAGAIYDGRIKIPAGGLTEKTEALERVIFHEYTHALVHRLSGGLAPMWLNEGLAQYEEGKDDAGYGDVLRKLALKGGIMLRRFEGSFMGLDQRSAQGAYMLSLSATSYIIREFGMFSAKKILEELSGGASLDDAIYSSVYLSYEDLERLWLESITR